MPRGEDTGAHPGRKVTLQDHVSRVTGPGAQAYSIDPRLGAFERRLMAVQEPDAPTTSSSQQGTRLDDRYSTLGDFTSKHGRVEEKAMSLRTYRSAGNLRRSITADPISRRKGLRQMTGGELEGR